MPTMEISIGYYVIYSRKLAPLFFVLLTALTNVVCYETKIGNKLNRSSPLPTPLLDGDDDK